MGGCGNYKLYILYCTNGIIDIKNSVVGTFRKVIQSVIRGGFLFLSESFSGYELNNFSMLSSTACTMQKDIG